MIHFSGSSDTLTQWDDDPESIHKYKVPIVVVRLGSRVGVAQEIIVKNTGSVVEDIAVKLTQRHDDLQWMTKRMIGQNHVSHNGRQWTPEHLCHNQLQCPNSRVKLMFIPQ